MPEPVQSGLLNTCPECGEVVDVAPYGPFEKIGCPACGSAMRVRTHFNHFIIQSELGEGGMSRVFRASDTTLGRDVALKILHKRFTADADLTSRFEREARLTASMSHPNVVKVYSVGSDQGYFYIAMELVEGESLEDLIRDGRMAEHRVLDIGVQVAQGLRAAHKGGLIHRDIKPGNILLTTSGVAKIVDFGLALVAGRDVDESSVIWATPFYVPPEKLHDEPEDARSDIYSLGATLFHALAGHPPFHAETSSLSVLREMKDQPVSLRDATKDVSEETCNVVDRMLQRDPEKRQADYTVLLQELNKARTLLGESVFQEAAKPDPYSQRTIGIAAVIFFIVAGFIIYQAQSNKGESAAGVADPALPIESSVFAENGQNATSTAAIFIEARGLLLSGKTQKAAAAFKKLIENYQIPQPTLNWAIFNSAICALIEGDRERSRELFARIEGEGWTSEDPEQHEAAVLFQEMSRHMRRELPVMESELEGGGSSDLRAMAWLAYGLKNWQDGRFDEAFTFFDAFRATEPPVRLEWINGYKGLVDRFESDRKLLAEIPKPSKGMSLGETEEALAKFEKMGKSFRTKGSAWALFDDRWARTAKAHEQLVQEVQARENERKAAMAQENERRRQEEMQAFADLAASLEGYGTTRDFAGAIAELEAAHFGEGPAKEAWEDELRIWKAAAGFTGALIEDLNRYGYTGKIGRKEGIPLSGRVEGATAEKISVRLEFGETTLSFSSISTEGLLEIGETLLNVIADESERRDRLEMLIFFARQTGRSDVAKRIIEDDALKDEGLAEFWDRISKIPAEEGAVVEPEGKGS